MLVRMVPVFGRTQAQNQGEGLGSAGRWELLPAADVLGTHEQTLQPATEPLLSGGRFRMG